ncbi:vacuolar sorting protein VPS33/slp1 [Modicella reniformis]|uniref:Vacuolar sorting protein VPS33/slp1 n=1 Tax=Modicella reniformis TaxID=1440133 RepID=A0A9P6ILV9_9FUNG|nr:vacuolar sorting protein VPS33/slp1 [Modicella reniformis]
MPKMPKGGSRASATPTMSLAAILAAHGNAAEKKSPSSTGNGIARGSTSSTSSSNPPTHTTVSGLASPVAPRPSPAVKQLQALPSHYASSSSSPSIPKKSSSTSNLPIHEDQVVSDATGSQINACQYNSTGEYILTGGVDRTIRLWNPATRFCIKNYEAHGWEVLDLAVSPENGKFASCGGDKTVFLWDVLSGMTLRRILRYYNTTMGLQILEEPKDSVTSIKIQGSDLLAGCVDGSIRTYDIRMGSLITDHIFEPITSVSFSKDGNCVLASSLDNTIRLMDRADGALLNAYKGHRNDKYKIRSCLSNSDAHVLSGSEDGKIYIWDLMEVRFLEVIDNVKVEPGRYKYVIVDTRASEIMASAGCHLADVLAREGTMYLENLEKRRSPSPNVEAIYFAMPTEDSVRRIIRDFKTGRTATYSAGHLFFLSPMEDKMFDHLRSSTDAKYIKSLKELFMDFYAIESRVFSLGNRNAFFNLFSPSLKERNQHGEINSVSKQLVSVCASLQLNPIVSYYRSSDLSMQTSKNIAMTVQLELDEYYKGQPRVGFKPPHLIIIDRSLDPITPILHDFYYQALATDLLPIKDGTKFEYSSFGQDGQPCEKVAILDENDKTFSKIRHNHITDCIKFLKTNVDNFVADAMSKPTTGNQLDAIREQMARLPQFQENKEKFSVHLSIVNECLEYIKNNKLVDISGLEQSLATGQLANGEIPKSFDPEIAVFLDDNSVRMVDRLRLLMLFFITQAVPQEMRNQLFQLSRCDYLDRDIANNLEFLGVKLDVAAPPPAKKWWITELLQKKSVAEDDIEYDLPRYSPVIKSIVDGVVNGTLDRNQYPYTLAPDELETIQAKKTVRSLRSAQPTFHHKGRRNEPQGRLIIFIAGGVTYSEIRMAYEMAATHNWDILIGSTHIMTPPSFMDDMKILRNGPPPPPPPPPRSPSPPPEALVSNKSFGSNPFSSVKNVFASGGSSGQQPGQQQQNAQPLPQRPTTQLQQHASTASDSSRVKEKLKGFWNEFK